MASTATDLPSNIPRQPDRPGVPVHTISTNYVDAVAKKSSVSSPTSPIIPISDGRKNSVGDALTSPTEAWRPDYRRKQNFKQEDLKRELQMGGILKGAERKAEVGDGTGGLGFSEVKSGEEERI
ncbi:hypothetical protein BJ878DRAFT_545802 [Calycina marina]|uniref:Uncharacterized protein n=1 Tax=Calycina marina TaxID=1763456 RepID=A0A9P7YX54_9HELO|nr:hypothetical protein BJ878DRAFT_545802 [Calycina marina]